MTPNPDTNPEMFEPLSIGESSDGAIFKTGFKVWKFAAGYHTQGRGGYATQYYRRKQQPKENKMKLTWNPIENGPPQDSQTVLVANRAPSQYAMGVDSLKTAYYSEGGWYVNAGEGRALGFAPFAPLYWAKIPFESFEVAPLKERPITITAPDGIKTVVFNDDGSVTVGCTTVWSQQMKAIIKKYQEVNK